ncbi:H-2 class II histocompatibility antigen, E-S beta chain-like [Engraulis encrasicolus]|uniref:H-2 class II histocompatibility antigen, E-S beta chain-like n=1 Tax=Engraulis encrasicolus TaxID=184585 RepID=UPI002FCF68FE
MIRIVVAWVLVSIITINGFDGYYNYGISQCRFSSQDLSDLEYIHSYVFNKVELIRFNSTVGKFVGYTELGVQNAERWNNMTDQLEKYRARKDTKCRPNAAILYKDILTKTAKPMVKLRLGTPSIGDSPAMLMCSAYDFYPKMIKLAWYRDEQEVTGDVISSEELADGDWFYQIHSHLEFTPKAGEKISCEVHHTSLKEPQVVDWGSSMPEPERNKIAIGAAGLVLGLIIAAAGFIYYKKKSGGRILVPSS